MTPETNRDHAVPQPADPREIDSETAALLRSWLMPILDRAEGWPALEAALEAKGYALAFRAGRLTLTDLTTGQRICHMRKLGTPLSALVARLGRPVVRPIPGRAAAGRLITQVAPPPGPEGAAI